MYNSSEKRDEKGQWTSGGEIVKKISNVVKQEAKTEDRLLQDLVKEKPRLPGETDKEFAKRVIDKLPTPANLPEEQSLYFETGGGELVDIKKLLPYKSAEETKQSGANAINRMWAASKGLLSKRPPISVKKEGDFYRILDGNSTFTAVKNMGWEKLIVKEEKS